MSDYVWSSNINSGSYAIYDFVIELQSNTAVIKSGHCPSNCPSDNSAKNTTVDSSNNSSDNTSKNDSATGNSAVYSGQNVSVGARNSSVKSSQNNANYNPVEI